MSAESPLFSIVTVTLNARTAAALTARSVLEQGFADYEYVVKDGCSTDGTAENLAALGRVRVISEPDGGVYDAMNQALHRCRGRYVCFMNAGDLFADTTRLDAVAEFIKENDYPPFLYGDVVVQGAAGPKDVLCGDLAGRLVCYRDRLSRFYLYRRMICHQVWFVERGLYVKLGGFDSRFRISAAYDFLLRMVLGERVRYVRMPELIAIYQGGGISGVDSPGKRLDRRVILKKHYSMGERAVYEAAFRLMRAFGRVLRLTVVPWMTPRQRGRFFGF